MEKVFPARLKEARVKLGFTQKELAEKAGISAASISSYENETGDKFPPLDVAFRIADTLGVSLDWLTGSTETRKPAVFGTYGDVTRMLLSLEDSGLSFSIDEDAVSVSEDEALEEHVRNFQALAKRRLGEQAKIEVPHPLTGEKMSERAIIRISAPALAHFFKIWKPIRAQYKTGIIDDELHAPWLEKQISLLSKLSVTGHSFASDQDSPSSQGRPV